ncbi:MAG: hypothetical protein MUC37_09490 [Hyphomicrobium sp.]|jgi:hypothetical protein|nr:hypothetical protein [Hyphomicrobium sp.]
MSALPQNVHQLLSRLNETTRHELDLVRELSEAIRRADDQLLKEVRSVSMLHELRREAIVNELQHLAQRLCALPAREPSNESVAAIEHPKQVLSGHSGETPASTVDVEEAIVTVEPPLAGRAGDWRQAAQRIDAELAQYFGGASPRH